MEEELLQWQNFNNEIDNLEIVDNNDLPGIDGQTIEIQLNDDWGQATLEADRNYEREMERIISEAERQRQREMVLALTGIPPVNNNPVLIDVAIIDEAPIYIAGVDPYFGTRGGGDEFADFAEMWGNASRLKKADGYEGNGRMNREVKRNLEGVLSTMAENNEISQNALEKLILKISEY